MRNHLKKSTILKILFFALAVFIIYLSVIYWSKLEVIASPFIISLIIAYLFNPLICDMESHGIKRAGGILIIYALLLGMVFVLCFYVAPEIVKDVGRLSSVMPGINEGFNVRLQYLQERYTKTVLPYGIKSTIDSSIKGFENAVSQYIQSVVSHTISFLSRITNYILVPFLLYYFLKDYKRIGQKVELAVPRKYRKRIIHIWLSIDEAFGNYIRSQLILSAIVASLTTASLIITGVDFAVMLGIINGITNIIPYFGPIIGAIPAIIVALLQSPQKAAYTTAAILIVQQIESGVIAPKITGDCVDLHPVTVILSLIAGGELFGLTGMILGVPAAAAIKIIYNDVMKNLF